MNKFCDCPRGLNISAGVFLVAVGIACQLQLWQITMPTWLSIVMLLLGCTLIILNSLSRSREKISDLESKSLEGPLPE